MYRNEHKLRYQSLPINIFDTSTDHVDPEYGQWPIHGEEPELRRYFTAHRHETLELICNTEGVFYGNLENAPCTLHAGDIMIVNPFIDHTGDYKISDDRNVYRCIQIELAFFMPAVQNRLRDAIISLLSGAGHFCEYISADHPAAGKIVETAERLYRLMQSAPDCAENDCLLMAGVYELLSYLIENFYLDTPNERAIGRDLQFIRSVTDYLELHYTDALSTSVISDALNYNLSHFCHLFRANFQNSFSHYLSEFRIIKSLYYHRNSSMRISEIAASVGFRDYGYFAEEFKKFTGIPPASFFLGRGK